MQYFLGKNIYRCLVNKPTECLLLLMLIICSSFLCLTLYGWSSTDSYRRTNRILGYDTKPLFISKHGNNALRNTTTKAVLLWTKFFGSDDWLPIWERSFGSCDVKCTVTTDHDQIRSADAVLFHYIDLSRDLPTYRDPSQVWVIFNMEPTPHVDLFVVRHLSLSDAFNWTMTYRQDSTVLAIYGEFVPLSLEERSKYRHQNYFENRTKMAASIVSHCHDDGKRYRLIHELSQYISIDQYGKCGNLSCPKSNPKICKSSDYKFRIAFENSFCKDYITEKYWSALGEGVIPVVNWHANQKPLGIVPDKTFINVYDFKSIADLGKYLHFVAHDEAAFNSYFEWKKSFRIETETTSTIHLCEELHKPRPSQKVENLTAWFMHDTCAVRSAKRTEELRRDRLEFDAWRYRTTREMKPIDKRRAKV